MICTIGAYTPRVWSVLICFLRAQTVTKTAKDPKLQVMVRSCCPSKHHFAKCVTNVEGRPPKTTWKCDHCGEHVISGAKFKPMIARIHLAATKTYGICSNLCRAQDDHAEGRRAEFRKLIADTKKKQETRRRKRKQQEERLRMREIEAQERKRKKVQPKIHNVLKVRTDASAADYAVAQWAIAHDIPANALKGPYWKMLNQCISRTPMSYTPMNPQKLKKVMLPMLRQQAMLDSEKMLKHQPEAGRTVTGDGATKDHIPLINFLGYVPGKGVTLLDVIDCTGHMAEGGTKDSLYVEWLCAI